MPRRSRNCLQKLRCDSHRKIWTTCSRSINSASLPPYPTHLSLFHLCPELHLHRCLSPARVLPKSTKNEPSSDPPNMYVCVYVIGNHHPNREQCRLKEVVHVNSILGKDRNFDQIPAEERDDADGSGPLCFASLFSFPHGNLVHTHVLTEHLHVLVSPQARI